jgi:hypothetical protein
VNLDPYQNVIDPGTGIDTRIAAMCYLVTNAAPPLVVIRDILTQWAAARYLATD